MFSRTHTILALALLTSSAFFAPAKADEYRHSPRDAYRHVDNDDEANWQHRIWLENHERLEHELRARQEWREHEEREREEHEWHRPHHIVYPNYYPVYAAPRPVYYQPQVVYESFPPPSGISFFFGSRIR